MATRAQVQAEINRLRRIPGVVARARLITFATSDYQLFVKDSRMRPEQQLRTASPGGYPGKWVPMTIVESAANVT